MANNKAIIIGRLGSTPSLTDIDGMCYTSFKLNNTTFRNGHDEVECHDIKAIGKNARVCCKYLNKGDLCCVEGHFEDSYIFADRVTFLTSKKNQ